MCISGWLPPEEQTKSAGGSADWRDALGNGGSALSPSDEFFELVFETKELPAREQ